MARLWHTTYGGERMRPRAQAEGLALDVGRGRVKKVTGTWASLEGRRKEVGIDLDGAAEKTLSHVTGHTCLRDIVVTQPWVRDPRAKGRPQEPPTRRKEELVLGR